MTYGRICPNCGNTDPRTIEDNGLRPRDPDYTLLCLARVPENVSSYDSFALAEMDRGVDENGLAECGWQWEPNQKGGD